MKLNFWQWIGVVLLIGGLALWYYENKVKTRPEAPKTPQSPALTTGPA